MRGNFTGKVSLSRNEKFPYYSEGTAKNGKKYHRFNLGLVDSEGNRANLELFGMIQDEIITMDTDNNKISISWDDRDDKEVIESVALYRKNIFNFIKGDRKEFISTYDAIEYLKEHADEIDGTNVSVTCNFEKNIYNGKISDRFVITNISEADSDNSRFTVSGDFFYNKESIDISEWKDNKRVYINGYIQTYIADKKKIMYVSHTVVFDATKIDFNKEKHVKLLTFKLGLLGIKVNGDKLDLKGIKGNSTYKMGVVLKYINSSQAEEVNFDDLTDSQKMAIELGMKKLEEYRKYGERVTEYKVMNFQIERDEYADGTIDMEISPDEFMDNVYTVEAVESEEDLTEEIPKDFINEPEDEVIDEENLFS